MKALTKSLARLGDGLAEAVQSLIDAVAPCPWIAHAGSTARHRRRLKREAAATSQRIYTPEQRKRRDESAWTWSKAFSRRSNSWSFWAAWRW
jgi:hypothetical protein